MTALVAVPDLDATLVEQINYEHRQAESAWRRSAEHAMRCGELLHQAKLDLDHGDWEAWIEQNFAGSPRTARRYMQLAAAQREDPAVLETVADESINAALERVASRVEPEKPPRRLKVADENPAEEKLSLTARQLVELVRAFGGETTEERVIRWVRRLSEPHVTLCRDCMRPVIEAKIGGETVRADRYEWLPRGECLSCAQTRHAHPEADVKCDRCNGTAIVGDPRPSGKMLAIDVGWGDEVHVRVVGERTDKRKGEAFHPLHRCPGEAVA